MTKNLLTARDIHGPYVQLLVNLQAENGQEWLDALNKFLKKQNPWEERAGKHLIDLSADPVIPRGWTVEEHRRPVGKENTYFVWDASKVKLHLDPSQKDGKTIEGNTLRTNLADQPVLNTNVLDYLIANPHLIPEDWKGKAIFFWGTIYRGSSGKLYVRFLYWNDGMWNWLNYWLGDDWVAGNSVVMRVK